MQWGKAVGAAMLVLAAAGCDGQRAPSQGAPVAQGEALPDPVAGALEAGDVDTRALGGLDDDDLRARAGRALREQRIHAPAGDSAVDYYLALRERAPAASGVAAALSELQPYVLIAVEQALARQDLAEAQRLLDLLARIDTHAPALPRLRDGLRLAQQQADRAEAATLAASMREPVASPAVPVVTTRTPATLAAAAAAVQRAEPAPIAPAPAVATQAPPAATPAPVAARALPRLLSDAAPRYPLAAQNRRIEGSVLVAFTIQPDGQVSDARPLSAQPAGVFEEAALAAAARWRFEATGERVSTTRTLTFRLPQAPRS